MTPNDGLTVAYVMSRFPKLTETFILAELEAMDRAGVAIELYPLLRQTGEPVQPAAVPWVERAHYLPFVSPAILRAQWSYLGDPRRRRRYIRAFVDMIRGTWRSPNFLVGGLGIFPKIARAALEMHETGVDHVHCHFANHPALAGWLIHRLVGIPYSFTAHGSDLHVDRTMLPTKVREAAFVVTISGDNRTLIESTAGSERRGQGRGHPLRRRSCRVRADRPDRRRPAPDRGGRHAPRGQGSDPPDRGLPPPRRARRRVHVPVHRRWA